MRHIVLPLACAAVLLTCWPVAGAEPLKVFAAGSLQSVFKDLAGAAKLDSPLQLTFASAGTLRERIEGGAPADLLLSADLAGPERLFKAGRTSMAPVPFARNLMCVAGRKTLGLTPETLLDRLLSPSLRLATSTPGADPGGDYALALFARAEQLHPGAEAILTNKAMHLFGGPNAMAPVQGHSPAASVFLGDNADLLLSYCSGAAALAKEVPDVVSVPVPASLEPNPVYGMAVLSQNPDALRFALFLVSTEGQAILKRHGLHGVLPDAAP